VRSLWRPTGRPARRPRGRAPLAPPARTRAPREPAPPPASSRRPRELAPPPRAPTLAAPPARRAGQPLSA